MNSKIIFLIIFLGLSSLTSAKFIENTDITSYINQLILENKIIFIPAGTFKIDANKSITPKNGSEINLNPKTKLIVIPNNYGSYRLFNINNVSDVKISGGTLVGDKYTHLGTTGEWGMGIEIKDSKNITISNIKIEKMWGDAIYIGTNGKNSNQNIILDKIEIDDNRRQGISIISVNTLKASNIIISNTKGKSPMNGIDIEPNNNKNILKNIDLKNIQSINNFAAGFQISLKKYNYSQNPISIKLSNYSDTGSRFGIKINGINSPVYGNIEIDSVNLMNNKTSNYCFQHWKNNKIKVNITNLKHDKSYVKNKREWCTPYTQNKFLIIKKVN